MLRRPPRSTLFPTRRSSDLFHLHELRIERVEPTFAGEGGDTARRQLDGLERLGVRLVCTGQTKEECRVGDRKSTRLNSSHSQISYAVFCLKKKKTQNENQ